MKKEFNKLHERYTEVSSSSCNHVRIEKYCSMFSVVEGPFIDFAKKCCIAKIPILGA